jgi:hypothetical protein
MTNGEEWIPAKRKAQAEKILRRLGVTSTQVDKYALDLSALGPAGFEPATKGL